MSFELISQSRIGWRVTCLESSDSLAIIILTPKRMDFLTLLLIGLGGWGFIFFGQMQFGFNPGFTFVCILIVLFPLYALLWNIVGKEIVTINSHNLTIQQAIFEMGFRQTYQISQVSNFRRSLTNPALFTLERNLQDWGLAGGSIAFDYSGRVCRFGLLLSKEDADVLVTKINQYLATSANSFSRSTGEA